MRTYRIFYRPFERSRKLKRNYIIADPMKEARDYAAVWHQYHKVVAIFKEAS